MSHFTPPADDIVSPVYIGGPDPNYPSSMNPLMRHYRQQTRGRNIFLMSDGTVLDSQVNGTPPNMIQPPTDPYSRAVYVPPGSGTAIEEDFYQVPYVVRTLYGGSANYVNAAEVTQLENAGYTVDP